MSEHTIGGWKMEIDIMNFLLFLFIVGPITPVADGPIESPATYPPILGLNIYLNGPKINNGPH